MVAEIELPVKKKVDLGVGRDIQAEILEELKKIREELKQLRLASFNFPRTKWRYLPIVLKNQRLQPGERLPIQETEEPGWCFYALLTSNNPYLEVWIDVYADRSLEIRQSFYSLNLLGSTQSIGGFRILKYDDTNKIYTMEFAPGMTGGFGIPFRERNVIYVNNPKVTPLGPNTEANYSFYAWLILFLE